MKYLFTILVITLFSSIAFATPPPRLQPTVAVLALPTIQFLPAHLRVNDLFMSRQEKLRQPLTAFFHPNLTKNKAQYRAWSYKDLAFFCKIEVQLEKAAKMPIKFRLGEVQYVERLEGKYE